MATFTIDSTVAQGLQGYTRDVVKHAIEQLSGNFGFDEEQIPVMVDFVMRNLGSPEIVESERREKKVKAPKEKKVKAPKEKKEKAPKEKKVKAPKEKKEKAPKEKKEKKETIPKMVMPWCGKIVEGCCHAITSNHDLYTQCMKEATSGNYCAKHENKRPCGTVEERMEADLMEYRDPTNNKKVKPFSVYMKKNNINEEVVKAEAERLGWEIDPTQFEEYVAKRGRPGKSKTPKSAAISDTESEGEMSPKPKKRGRPKKVKTEENEKSSMPDLIAAKMKENQAVEEEEKVEEEKVEAPKEKKMFGPFKMRDPPTVSPIAFTSTENNIMDELVESEPETEDEGIVTEEWEAPDGNTYLIDGDNNVYDKDDESYIGKKIDGEFVADED